jgi:hypothetical protein
MPPDNLDLISKARSQWRRLLQASTWLLALVGSFVFAPPIWNFKEDASWVGFTHFLVAAIVGLSFFPISKWSKPKYRLKWWLVTAVFLIISAVAFFQYQALRAAWTVDYDGARVIIGSAYTQDALNYRAKVLQKEQRVITDQELLMDYAGATESVWAIDGIFRRRLIFAGVYVALISLFSISIIALIQAL